jgi:spore coat polysaccharide biosynthesis protein SpsF
MTRVMKCAVLNKAYLATSRNPENDILAEMADKFGWNLYRGSENDVLSRFVNLVEKERPDIVVRICADNFAIDPNIITDGVRELIDKNLDVCSAFINKTYPFGAGAEVSSTDCLLRLWRDTEGKDPAYREHIYSFAYEHPQEYRIGGLKTPESLKRPEINISVDTKKDYELMRRIYERFKERESSFTLSELIGAWDALDISRLNPTEAVKNG